MKYQSKQASKQKISINPTITTVAASTLGCFLLGFYNEPLLLYSGGEKFKSLPIQRCIIKHGSGSGKSV